MDSLHCVFFTGMKSILRTVVALAFAAAHVNAGRYPTAGTQTFTYADNTVTLAPENALANSTFGTGFTSVSGNSLRLSKVGLGGGTGSLKIPDLDPAKQMLAFDATFTVRMTKNNATAVPGAGWALNFGPLPSDNGAGPNGFTMAGGLAVGFDTFADNATDVPSVQILCNGATVANFPATVFTEIPPLSSGTFTLTNPVTGGTSASIAFSAAASSVQSAMRAVSGWSTVIVTGTAPNWTVNRGAVGSYADPTGNPITLNPSSSLVSIVNTVDATPSTNEIWTVSLLPRGFVFDATPRAVAIHWDDSGLDVTYNGQSICANVPTPGFTPAPGHRFGITASTAGSNTQDTFIDDLLITTVDKLETGGPVITEFVAENDSGFEDDFVENSDWIEIYNGQNASANLAGWRLTDIAGGVGWTFPAVTLAPYEYKVVFASARNLTNPASWLHTNFKLGNVSGYLALIRPDNSVATAFNYGPQYSDVSYGEKGLGRTLGYLLPPTPGAPAGGSNEQAPAGKAEDVLWSRESGIITGTTPLSITAPLAPGAVIRYTLDNSTPNASSPLYSAPFALSASTNLKARIYTPGRLPGDTSARTLLLVDSTLTNYNGSGQLFSSNIPLMIFDSFGTNVDAENGALRPLRYTACVVIDTDPLTGRASLTTLPNYAGRGATHVHGESSAGFPQRSYNWEAWNSDDQDKDIGVLGMLAHSDWVLHGPWSDKGVMRNHLMFSMMRDMRPDYLAPRTRQVEVFFNQNGGAVGYEDYRGIYTVLEKLTRGKNRANVEKLNDKVTDPLLLSGGYIFKRDKPDPGSTAWNTAGPQNIGMQSHYPEIYTAQELAAISTYINNFQTALNEASFGDPTTGYAAWIDVSSFIDGQLAVELAKQVDGYVFSTYWHKPRGGKIKAGPIWDFNIALGNANYAQGERADGWNYDGVGANSGGVGSLWYPRLHADPLYRRATFDRYWDWRRSVLSNSAWTARVDTEVAKLTDSGNPALITANSATSIQNPAARHFRKYIAGYGGMSTNLLGGDHWPNPPGWDTRTTYQSEVDYLKNWMLTRLSWMDDQYLSGSTVLRPPNFNVATGDTPAGTPLSITAFTGTPPAGTTYATGTIYYTLDGSDPAAGATLPTEYTLISGSSAPCKWLVPSGANGGAILTASAGAQQWTTYTDPPNIANWTTGVTGVGYDTGDGNYTALIGAGSNVVAMKDLNATCYVRVAFIIPDAATLANIATLNLSMKYDDGFRAFINGSLVAGRNDADPTIISDASTAIASAVRDESAAVTFEEIDISIGGIPVLRVGTNVLAIHCLNLPAGSSDLIMAPKLTYLQPGAGGGSTGGIAYTGPLTLNTTTSVKARLQTSLGAWTPVNTATYTVNTVPADATNLVISEMMYNPANPTVAEQNSGWLSASEFEYIELQNISAQTLDMTSVRFSEGINFNFNDGDPTALAMPPGARVLIVGNKPAYLSRHGAPPSNVKIGGTWVGSLANGGEQLLLRAESSTAIRDFMFDNNEPWPKNADGGGYSIVLSNPHTNPAHGNGLNWRLSVIPGGTPGSAKSSPFAGSPSGDTDGDGFSDYLEYALGNSELIPGTGNRPNAAVQSHTVSGIPGNYLTFTYRRNNAADGVNYFVELSTNLTAWDSAPTAVTYVGSSANGDGSSTVTHRATQLFNPVVPQFMRLRVSP